MNKNYRRSGNVVHVHFRAKSNTVIDKYFNIAAKSIKCYKSVCIPWIFVNRESRLQYDGETRFQIGQ